MHKLLEQQVKRCLLDKNISLDNLQEFIQEIDGTYKKIDNNQELLDKFLKLVPDGLAKRNQDLLEQLQTTSISKKQLEQSLEQSLALLNLALSSTYDGVCVESTKGNLVTHNKTILDMFDLHNELNSPSSNMSFLNIIKEKISNREQFEQFQKMIETFPDTTQSCVLELKNGKFFECISRPRYLKKIIIGRILNFRDITKLKCSEQKAIYHSNHDDLTGLPNRTLFFDRLAHAIDRHHRSNKMLVILFLDLDGFKYINDSLGHAAGDNLIKQVALRLNVRIRSSDTIARYGGDEFVILLEQIEHSATITAKANEIISEFHKPFIVNKNEIYTTTSIGISIFPQDSIHPEILIKNADMAMYQAKNLGRNNFQFFSQELEQIASHRLTITNRLKVALNEDQFKLFYQPKICTETGKIVGAEALIRWCPNEDTIVYPMEFIPIAEENGLILGITEWVINQACRDIKILEKNGLKEISMAINISGCDLKKSDLVSFIIKSVNKYKIKPQLLEIEITESILLTDMDKTIEKLSELHDYGITITIDDFGTGYSSLSYLKKLPIDIIKIDRSFIDGMTQTEKNMALVSTMISLAHTLDLSVVAEGVDNEKTLHKLVEEHCDLIQGYIFSPALPLDDLNNLIQQKNPFDNLAPFHRNRAQKNKRLTG